MDVGEVMLLGTDTAMPSTRIRKRNNINRVWQDKPLMVVLESPEVAMRRGRIFTDQEVRNWKGANDEAIRHQRITGRYYLLEVGTEETKKDRNEMIREVHHGGAKLFV